jgi:hypothetical protein
MFKKILCVLSVIVIPVIITDLNAQVDPGTENLTHSWTFNDETANDYVGGANGTLKGNAVIDEGSLLTIAANSWLELPAGQIALNTYDEVTIETWYIPISAANTNYTMLAFFGKTQNSLGVDYYFITSARGDDMSRAGISCGVYSSPWNGESKANGPEIDDGELHHMVSTLSSTDITLYIDGALQASTPLDTNNAIALISPDSAYLAKGGYTGDPTWIGEILEFNIYNKALSADEVLFQFYKGASTSIGEPETSALPDKFRLMQNYPNPFNPTTKIVFELSNRSKVNLKVFDLSGRDISTLVNDYMSAGQHSVQFNGTNLSTGVYIYRMITDNEVFTRKMMLLK